MATYIRHATRALKLKVNLDTARTRQVIATQLTAFRVLEKGTGTYTLIFIFPDDTELELTSAEISNGDRFDWDIKELRMTHTAQANVTATFIAEQQIF